MELASEVSGPLIAIGDLHGQVHKLERLLTKLKQLPDWNDRTLVFLGDFVDRGVDSKGTLDLILQLKKEKEQLTAVMGNHDFAMLAALGAIPTHAKNWKTTWLEIYDSDKTFESYGVPVGQFQALLNTMPQEHLDFLLALPWYVEHPDYFFVHAGLRKNQSLAEQRKALKERDFELEDIPWLFIRQSNNASSPEDCSQTVVVGHVYTSSVCIFPRRIMVDTTGGMVGELSAVLLPENKVITSA
ncbi:Diadenosine tetraphosphatase [Planctomycetales bacterium 10988]|nr:Diadenosine tetraphosphatase [Planctomycetales bacterium 10988]